MSIRAISLDVGWTLAFPRASIWEIFGELCTAAGSVAAPQACERLVRALWAHGQEHAERTFHGGASYSDSDEEFAAVFAQMAQLIFAHFGVADGQDDLIRRFLERFWSEANWCVFPDVMTVLAELKRRGLRLGVLSNAPSNLPIFLQHLGIAPFLDFTVVSAVERMKKPDRRIFATATQRAGVAPHEILHVGDMYLEDILGGQAAGLRTLLIERHPHALFPHHRDSEVRDIDPSLVITDLRQVLAQLDAEAAD